MQYWCAKPAPSRRWRPLFRPHGRRAQREARAPSSPTSRSSAATSRRFRRLHCDLPQQRKDQGAGAPFGGVCAAARPAALPERPGALPPRRPLFESVAPNVPQLCKIVSVFLGMRSRVDAYAARRRHAERHRSRIALCFSEMAGRNSVVTGGRIGCADTGGPQSSNLGSGGAEHDHPQPHRVGNRSNQACGPGRSPPASTGLQIVNVPFGPNECRALAGAYRRLREQTVGQYCRGLLARRRLQRDPNNRTLVLDGDDPA